MNKRPVRSQEKDKPPPPPAGRGTWKKLLLSLVTVIILLLGGEMLCRYLFPRDPESRWSQHLFRVDSLGFSELNDIMIADPHLFWRVRPNLRDHYLTGFVGTETFLHFMVSTDAKGLRILKSPQEKGELLFLGDSCTFGIGVEAEEIYALKTADDLGLGVRNLSCPGYTLFQGSRLLDLLGWGSKPKALIAAFGFNDRLMWDGLTDPEHAEVLARQSSGLARSSRLFYCMELALSGGWAALKSDPDSTVRRVPPELFRSKAEALLIEAEKRGVPVLFLFWPRIEWMSEPETLHPYGEALRGLEAAGRLKILDLAPTFRESGGERLYLDGIHATAEGHAVCARELSRALREMGLRGSDKKDQ